jgi:hypothetical protein
MNKQKEQQEQEKINMKEEIVRLSNTLHDIEMKNTDNELSKDGHWLETEVEKQKKIKTINEGDGQWLESAVNDKIFKNKIGISDNNQIKEELEHRYFR